MLKREDLTRDLVVDSLYSKTCPACGDPKGEEKSLCWICWRRLPRSIQGRLYLYVGHGYEEAILDALNHLKATRFHTERREGVL